MSINHSARFQQIWKKKIVARWYQSEGDPLTAEKPSKDSPARSVGEFGASLKPLERTAIGQIHPNCFDPKTTNLTTTGRRMKRFRRLGDSLGVGGRPLIDFLLVTSDNDLKQRFGRKFLNVRKGSGRGPGTTSSSKSTVSMPTACGAAWTQAKNNGTRTWQRAIMPQRQQKRLPPNPPCAAGSIHGPPSSKNGTGNEQQQDFSPIKVGTTAYLEIKEIQARIKSSLSSTS